MSAEVVLTLTLTKETKGTYVYACQTPHAANIYLAKSVFPDGAPLVVKLTVAAAS